MKKKNLLMTTIAIFGLATISIAQTVPTYVPTNGLVGWWPFNGNANDESGNGNNGTVYGATLATDRFGVVDKSYDFDGVDDFIQILDASSLRLQQGTINCWVKYSSMDKMQLFVKQNINNAWDSNFGIEINDYNQILGPGPRIQGMYVIGCGLQTAWTTFTPGNDLSGTVWHQLTAVFDVGIMKIYIDGILMGSLNTPISSMNACAGSDLLLGRGWQNFPLWYSGRIDDLAIWNRALNQQEVTELYNAVNCANNTTITPQTNSIPTGSSAIFTASTSDLNPSYVWQSDLGQDFQTLTNFGNYSGVNAASLNIANVQLSSHNQPIRVISTSGNCIDTSNVAVINILDTCIVTVYDTLLTTVTDTLIINTTLSLPAPNNENTILIYPNPASDHITIDNGNYSAMAGYSIKITNNAGQEVFLNAINQQQFYVDLSTWTGNGLYFVHLIDSQNNTVTVRKIVLQ